ncbi:hypothetical protein L1N85_03915 [Paenibacillus alkaliterrae]|uniref:hypothetical protein n=1 Tax=Paenibacillus alkaliterrae TaxID=320909 RepID=UPI001F29AE26|nr:hypothetical protein [Paenibacillus alkaliterrae]MCF2937578.1 hypothetical protein [Paenibacillus alkaliterrae]
MKLSGFLVGSLIGAAATVYVSRRRPGAVSWAANAMSDVCSSVTRKAMAKIMSKDFKEEAAAFAPKHSDDTAEKSEAAWVQIETIVNKDPALKREADKIKAESSSLKH